MSVGHLGVFLSSVFRAFPHFSVGLSVFVFWLVWVFYIIWILVLCQMYLCTANIFMCFSSLYIQSVPIARSQRYSVILFKMFLFVLPHQNLDLCSSRIDLCVWNEVAVQLTQHLLLRRPFSPQCTVFLLCHKSSCWLGLGLGSVFCSIRQIYFEVIIISLQFLIEFLYNQLSLKKIIFLFFKTISECFIMNCAGIISVTSYLLLRVFTV